ncbi:MAG TPA: helix-turn-helix domain-containing protein [Gemmataceae bacterium]|jgi:predicted DNA-binding protein (UPF0251 family)
MDLPLALAVPLAPDLNCPKMSQNVPPEKDVVLAMALAAGFPQGEAAERVGVNRRTVYRKLRRPEFRRLVADLRGELVARALGRLADNMTRAADALAALLDTADDRVRLRTARAVISLGLRLRDSVDLTERVHDLEQDLARAQEVAP